MLDFLSVVNPELVKDFSLIGWLLAVTAVLAKFDWENEGKSPRHLYGLAYDIVTVSFAVVSVSVVVYVSVTTVQVEKRLQTIEQATAQPGENPEAAAAIALLEDQLQDITAERDRLRDALDEAGGDGQALADENDRLRRENRGLQGRNDALEQRIEGLSDPMDRLADALRAIADRSGEINEADATRAMTRIVGPLASYAGLNFEITYRRSQSISCSADRGPSTDPWTLYCEISRSNTPPVSR